MLTDCAAASAGSSSSDRQERPAARGGGSWRGPVGQPAEHDVLAAAGEQQHAAARRSSPDAAVGADRARWPPRTSEAPGRPARPVPPKLAARPRPSQTAPERRARGDRGQDRLRGQSIGGLLPAVDEAVRVGWRHRGGEGGGQAVDLRAARRFRDAAREPLRAADRAPWRRAARRRRPTRRGRRCRPAVDQGAREADRGHDPARERAGPADPRAVGQQGSLRPGSRAVMPGRKEVLLPKRFRPALNAALTNLRLIRPRMNEHGGAMDAPRSDCSPWPSAPGLARPPAGGAGAERRQCRHAGLAAARSRPVRRRAVGAGAGDAGPDPAEPTWPASAAATPPGVVERPSERAPDGNAVSMDGSSS